MCCCWCCCWTPTPPEVVQGREQKWCALCSGKTGRTSLQIVRYSQELILWAQFLCLLISRKALKFWITILRTRKTSETSRNFLQKICAWLHVLNSTPLLTKITYILSFPSTFWSSFLELSEVLSPRWQSLFHPNKTYLAILTLCILFFSWQLVREKNDWIIAYLDV